MCNLTSNCTVVRDNEFASAFIIAYEIVDCYSIIIIISGLIVVDFILFNITSELLGKNSKPNKEQNCYCPKWISGIGSEVISSLMIFCPVK